MDFKDPWQPDTAETQQSREGQNFKKGLRVPEMHTLLICSWNLVELCPPKRYIALSIYECDLI